MKNNILTIILLGIAIGLCILIVEYHRYLRQEEEKELNNLIEQLQIKNDSLKLDNELLDSLILTQRAIADSLSKEVQITNRVIKKLKNVRYERIRAIDSMGTNNLFEFFSEFDPTGTDN